MPLLGFKSLYELADRLHEPVPVVAAGGVDPTVLEALSLAQRRGWVQPILAGSITAMHELAKGLDIDLTDFRLINTDDPAAAAVSEVKSGRAACLMKGQIATPALMKAMLAKDIGLRTSHCICQIVLMEIPRDSRRFLLADTGITIQPTLDQKSDILSSMVNVAQALDDGTSTEPPRMAIMSATEKPTDAMPDTLEAVELSHRPSMSDSKRCLVQGPLSFDLAYTSDAAEKKRVEGTVVGAADGMLFPNLLAANLTVKAIMYTADCQFGGVLCGAACPVVFMSRADSSETRLNSLSLTLRMLAAANSR